MNRDGETFHIRTLLGERSYRVYQMRTKQKKTFREIGAAIKRTPNRANQLYRASLRRIELKMSGGEDNPEFSLSVRARHCVYKTFENTDVTKNEVIRALKSGKLHPGGTRGYGWKTHREVCKWAGVAPEQCG